MLKTSKIHIHSVYLIQTEEKDDDDDWIALVPDPQKRQKQERPFLVVS